MIATNPNPTAWNYWRCELDTAAMTFGPFAGMVELWRSRIPAGGALPSRRAFDFADFRKWWGHIAIARIEREPFDVRFTLWGTKLTQWWGVDYTGRRIGEAAKNPEVWKRTEGRYFEAMAGRPFIGIAAGRLDQHDRSYKKILSVDLPMGEGAKLTHVLAVHMEIDLEVSAPEFLHGCPMTGMDISALS